MNFEQFKNEFYTYRINLLFTIIVMGVDHHD